MNRPRRPGLRPLASINVTPLVDVMLVLLIVFMVTATLDRQGIGVNLPAGAGPSVPGSPTTVTLDRDRILYLNDTPMEKDQLVATLKSLADAQSLVVFRADQEVPYGAFVEVVAMVRASGIERLTLETEAPTPRRP